MLGTGNKSYLAKYLLPQPVLPRYWFRSRIPHVYAGLHCVRAKGWSLSFHSPGVRLIVKNGLPTLPVTYKNRDLGLEEFTPVASLFRKKVSSCRIVSNGINPTVYISGFFTTLPVKEEYERNS